MATNPTPTNDHQLLLLCDQVATGCERMTTEVGLGSETGVRLRTALQTAQDRMAEVKRLKPRRSRRRAEFRKLDRLGEQVIGRCRLRLAALYGSRFNADWRAAGFPEGSTMVPEAFAARQQVLAGLAVYFEKRPELESLDMGTTAALCREMHESLLTAHRAARDGETALRQAVLVKRAALKALRTCLRATIRRLHRLLSGDDVRWMAFGLKVPQAGAAMPQAVTSITLTPSGGGSLEVHWPAALHAEVYQVQARLMGTSDFKTVQTVRGQEAHLTGWPTGQIVEVQIVASNPLGLAPPSPVMALWLA